MTILVAVRCSSSRSWLTNIDNPYSPGAGRRPPALTGRDAELRSFHVLLERCERGLSDRGKILHGLRGVGKTVLLNEFHGQASARKWITAKLEASPGKPLAPLISQALYRSLRTASGRFELPSIADALRVFSAFSLEVDPGGSYTFGVDLKPAAGRADSGDLVVDLSELFSELGATSARLGVGTVLLIDEMQDVDATELTALNVALHEMGQGATALPVVVVGAGLPSLPGILSEATSYAEWLFEYQPIGALQDPADRDALVRPSEALGVQWHDDAVTSAIEASGGYPYFLQTYGKFVWDYARASPVTREDVATGGQHAEREIDAGLYLARWSRATPGQRQLLRAIAVSGDGVDVPVADVAQRLGRRRSDLGVARDQLIKKGLVYAPERGLLTFTVPGMADFVSRQPA